MASLPGYIADFSVPHVAVTYLEISGLVEVWLETKGDKDAVEFLEQSI